jgi:hypothetical protein
VAGSVLGGVALDRLGNTMRAACIICAASSLAGLVVLLPAFLFTQTFAAFMALFAIGQMLVFLLQVRCQLCP